MLTIVIMFLLVAVLARLIGWALGDNWQSAHWGLYVASRLMLRWACVVAFTWFTLLVYVVLDALSYGPVT